MTPFRIILLVGGGVAAFGLGVRLGANRTAVRVSAENAAWAAAASASTTQPTSAAATVLSPLEERARLQAIFNERLKGDRTGKQRDLRARIAELPPEEIRAFLDAMPEMPGTERSWWMQALVESWAAQDPAAAVRWVQGKARSGMEQSQQLLNDVVHVWAEKDPAGAAREVAAFKSLEEIRVAAGTVLAVWVQRDPAAAQAWIKELPAGETREEASVSLARELARHDPRAALEFALAAAPARWSERSVSTALSELARVDPAGAVQAFDALPQGGARNRAASRIASTLAEKDPAVAGQFALTLPAGPARTEAVKQVAQAMSRNAPEEAWRWIDESVTDPAERRGGLEALMGQLSGDDPAAASQFLTRLPEKERSQYINAIVGNWSYRDPVATIEWLKTVPETNERSQAMRRSLAMLGFRDPERATMLAPSMLSGTDLTQAYATLGAAWSWREPKRAFAFVEQLTDPADRAEFLAGMGRVAGRSQPKEVLQAIASLPPGPGRDKATDSTVSMWANRDPQSAGTWLASQPEVNAAGFGAVAAAWVEFDSPSLERWLTTLPAGPRQDAALASAAMNSVDSNPSRGAAWALGISNETKRGQALDQVVGSWLMQDRAGAIAWLDAAALPEATKRRLREKGR